MIRFETKTPPSFIIQDSESQGPRAIARTSIGHRLDSPSGESVRLSSSRVYRGDGGQK